MLVSLYHASTPYLLRLSPMHSRHGSTIKWNIYTPNMSISSPPSPLFLFFSFPSFLFFLFFSFFSLELQHQKIATSTVGWLHASYKSRLSLRLSLRALDLSCPSGLRPGAADRSLQSVTTLTLDRMPKSHSIWYLPSFLGDGPLEGIFFLFLGGASLL